MSRTVLVRRNAQGYAFDSSEMRLPSRPPGDHTIWIPLAIPPDTDPEEVKKAMEEETGDTILIITREETP